MQHDPIAAARPRWWFRHLACVALTVACVGCASGDRTLEAVDPDAVSAQPTYDQVHAIVQNKCATCHNGGGGEDFHEGLQAAAVAADDIPSFTTCSEIVAQRTDIFDRAVDNTMPPGALPRLTSEEKLIIQRWIENGAPAPCN